MLCPSIPLLLLPIIFVIITFSEAAENGSDAQEKSEASVDPPSNLRKKSFDDTSKKSSLGQSNKRWDLRVHEHSLEVEESRRGRGGSDRRHRQRSRSRSDEDEDEEDKRKRKKEKCEEEDDDEEDKDDKDDDKDDDDEEDDDNDAKDLKTVRTVRQTSDQIVKADNNNNQKNVLLETADLTSRTSEATSLKESGALLLNESEKRRKRSREKKRCRKKGRWSEWKWVGECSDDCGGFGRQTRKRECLSERCPCKGKECERKRCNTTPCIFPRLSCAPGLKVSTERGKRGEDRLVCKREDKSGGDTKAEKKDNNKEAKDPNKDRLIEN